VTGGSTLFRAVIFDLDDTLLRSVEQKWAHHKAVASEIYGFELTDECLAEHWGKPFDVMIGELYRHSDTPENMLRACASLDHRFPKGEFDDAVPAVTALLDANLQVGVLTGAPRRHAIADLERFGFPVPRLAMIQGHDDSSVHKPDPRVFDAPLGALRTRGITAHEVAYVGDSLIDHAAAVGAGISFIGVATGLVRVDAFHEAGAVAATDSLAACVEWILRTTWPSRHNPVHGHVRPDPR
jgi:phosphoglycolate phosphatase-like HAD superfamily hydrolase